MYLDWSWWAFFAGVLVTVVAEFVILVAVAIKQFRKQRKAMAANTDAFSNLMANWNKE
jgi:hypothetical protein